MATCFHIAKYIIEKKVNIPALKLHKLLYYAQAWSLVWDDMPLFKERIEAWIHGPIIPKFYHFHRGKYSLSLEDKEIILYFDKLLSEEKDLSESQKDTIDHVLDYYGEKPTQWLSDLTRLEDPWKKARDKFSPDEKWNEEITHADMVEYYSSII